jgi:tripartite-type tricarboxylate transporter receptor subunit TctC
MLIPAKVPEPIINQIYQTEAKVVKDPEAVKKLADDGLVAVASTPAEFTRFVRSEIAEWSKLVKEMKL